MATPLMNELRQAGLTLKLTADGRLRWESASQPPADLMSKVRAGKDQLRNEILSQRDAAIRQYRKLEHFLEMHLWDYVRADWPPKLRGEFIAALAEIDLIEEQIRQQFGALGCLSYHGACSAEQVGSKLCCDSCWSMPES